MITLPSFPRQTSSSVQAKQEFADETTSLQKDAARQVNEIESTHHQLQGQTDFLLNEDYFMSEIWVFRRHYNLLRMAMWNFKSFTVILYYNVAIVPKSFENVAYMPKSCIFMPMSNFSSMFLCLSHFLLYCETLQERYYVILNWVTFTPNCVEI